MSDASGGGVAAAVARVRERVKAASPWAVGAGVAAAAAVVGAGVAASAVNAFVAEHVRAELTWAEWLYVAGVAARAAAAQRGWACGAGGAHAADGAPRIGSDPISPEWLTRVLARAGMLAPGTAVSSVAVQGLKDNRGLRGVMLSVDVEYAAAAAAPDTAATTVAPAAAAAANPRRLILKTVLFQHTAHRYDMLVAHNHRDALYYGSALEATHHFSGGVRALHAAGNAATGDCVILMEDLRSSRPGCLGVNLYMGNQVWGIPAEVAATMAPRTAPDLLRVMFRRAAEIHAPYWNDRATLLAPPLRWLKATDWYRGVGAPAWTLAVKATHQSWLKAKAKRAGSDALPDRLVRIMDASFAATSWEALQARLQDATIPATLTHGDFHASNALWQPPPAAPDGSMPPPAADGDDGTLFMVDWAEVGVWEPCTELAQAMISDVRPAVRRAHEDALLALYVDRLRTAPGSRVPADFTVDAARVLYARGGPERWVFFIAILAVMPLPDAAVKYFADQFLAFVDDHGAHAPARGPGGEPAYPLGSLGMIGMVFG